MARRTKFYTLEHIRNVCFCKALTSKFHRCFKIRFIFRSCFAAAIRLREQHAACGVAARGGGHHTRRILLREHKAIHRHRFGGDVGGGNSAVLNTFRILTILHPLRGSQAAFADKHRFILQRGRQLRDDLLLHSVGKLCSRRWGPEIRSRLLTLPLENNTTR